MEKYGYECLAHMLMGIMHFSHICVAFDCASSRCKYLPLAFAQCCTTLRISNIYSRSAFVCPDGVVSVAVCSLRHSAYAKHKHKQEIHFSFVCSKSSQFSVPGSEFQGLSDKDAASIAATTTASAL